MNKTLLPIILGHEPGGTSVNTVVHFAQEVNSGKFSKFDYGKVRILWITPNLIRYILITLISETKLDQLWLRIATGLWSEESHCTSGTNVEREWLARRPWGKALLSYNIKLALIHINLNWLSRMSRLWSTDCQISKPISKYLWKSGTMLISSGAWMLLLWFSKICSVKLPILVLKSYRYFYLCY